MKDRIFIIGGGPSLTGFDFERLRDEDTMAVNYAVKHIVNPTYFITADSGVIRKAVTSNFWDMPDETNKYVIMGSEHPRYFAVKDMLPAFDKVISPARFDGEIGFHKSQFATGKNTGFCALQLAVLLGYKEIYLLGFDLARDNGKKYFYGEGGTDSPYDLFLSHFITGLAILKKKGVLVHSCSSKSRLNDYIPFAHIDVTLPSMPLFISHYTRNTPYETEVLNLKESLDKFGLEYDLEGIDSLGTWRANSNWCAKQVQKALVNNPFRSILRVDADAVVQQYPKLFERSGFKPDIAACIWDGSKCKKHGEFMGGTMFFNNTDRTRIAVDMWVKACTDTPLGRNGDLLYEIVKKLRLENKLTFKKLPLSYCKIFDFYMEGVDKPVIEHFQASRRFKRLINQRRNKRV